MAQDMWMPADLQAKQLEMARKQKLQQAMLGAVQPPQAQMVGGQYIAPGVLGQALPLIKALMGQKLENDATQANSQFLVENKDRLGSAGNPKDLFKSGKWEPTSINQYSTSGRASDLKLRQKEYDPLSGTTWTTDTVTTPDGKELQLGHTRDGTETWRSVKSGTTVNVGPEKAWDKEGPKAMIKQLGDEYPKVQEAIASLDNYKAAKAVLGQGIITGSLADQETAVRGLFSKVFNYDDSAVANTQEMIAIMGQVVMKNISALGAGTAISDADRQYTEKTSGASMAVKLQALQNLISLGEATAANKLQDYSAMVNRVRNSPEAPQGTIDALTVPFEMPPDLGVRKGFGGRYEPVRVESRIDDQADPAKNATIPPPIQELQDRLNKWKQKP